MTWLVKPIVVLSLIAVFGRASLALADADLAAGKPLYTKNCLVCHGLKGTGNGPSGRGLNPKPTDLSAAPADDAEWFKATKLGTKAVGKSSGMQGFAKELTDDQIHEVLAYVKTFKQAAPAP